MNPKNTVSRTIHILTGTGLLLTFLFIFGRSFSQSPADFSGRWSFDKSHSDPGQGGSFLDAKTTLLIRQSSDSIVIYKTIRRPGTTDVISDEQYLLNGTTNLKPDKNELKTVTTEWSDDLETLIVYTDWTFNSGGSTREVHTREAYRLSNQGKTMTVLSTSEYPSGEKRMILVYNRI